MADNIRNMDNEYTQQKNKARRIQQKRTQVIKRRIAVFGGILLSILLVLCLLLVLQMHNNHQLKQEQIAKEQELEKLKDNEIALKEKLKQLNNKEYITKIARSEYFLSNDGEMIFKMPNEDKKKSE